MAVCQPVSGFVSPEEDDHGHARTSAPPSGQRRRRVGQQAPMRCVFRLDPRRLAMVAFGQLRFIRPLGNTALQRSPRPARTRQQPARPDPAPLPRRRQRGGNKSRHLTVFSGNPAWGGEARGERRIQDPPGRPAGRRHRGPVLSRQDNPGLRACPADRRRCHQRVRDMTGVAPGLAPELGRCHRRAGPKAKATRTRATARLAVPSDILN